MFSLFQVQKVIECGTINVADEELAQKIKKKCTVHEIKWYITFFKLVFLLYHKCEIFIDMF